MEKTKREIDGLLDACQRGEEDAYRQLFEQYHQRVFQVAFRFCGNIQEAEDITQDVFLKVLKDISRFRGDAGFFTWLYRITVNVSLDKNRSRKRREKQLAEENKIMDLAEKETIGHGDNPSSQKIWQDELQENLQKALNQMKPKLKTVIVLKHLQGLSYEELGKIMGCSEGTISSRLNRARRQLKDILSRMGIRD